MLFVLIINTQVIFLVTSSTYLPTTERDGYANIEQWYGGTLIYAHNYLSGAEFDEAETITAIYADGSAKQFEVTRTIVIDGADWTTTLLDYSTPETITLATCYPEHAANTSMRLIVELTEVHNDDIIRCKSQSC
jgi:sortase (surface protein transpeptidase)